MKNEILSRFPMTDLTVLALGIFVTVFCLMLVWIFRKGTNREYKHASFLPLEEGGKNE